MNKEREDLRRNQPVGEPTWKVCFDTMEEVKRSELPDGQGITIEFVGPEGNGRSVDIFGEDYKAFKRWDKDRKAKAKKAEKAEEKPDEEGDAEEPEAPPEEPAAEGEEAGDEKQPPETKPEPAKKSKPKKKG
jgi:hypothetical protein